MRRIECLLFGACWLAFAYFHQGGGWGQNVRFAQTRAIVEEGRFAIDSYLLYFGEESERGTRLVRVPVQDGEYTWHGQSCVLAWTDQQLSGYAPVAGRFESNQVIAPVQAVAISGDVTFQRGHFYPNKAPGISLLAVPAYFALYHGGRLLGANPDDWWTLTRNAWLSSVVSVALVCAFGCLVFFRFVLRLSGNAVVPAVVTTLALALGTMFWQHATMLSEHAVQAALLFAAFHYSKDARPRALVLGGLCAGATLLINSLAVGIIVLMACWIAANQRRALLWFGLGVLGPVLALGAHNFACFGTLLATSYSEYNPFFRSAEGSIMGVFNAPRWDVLLAIVFSPFRGLFFSSPVLCLGVAGLWVMVREKQHRADAIFCLAVAAYFIAFNICFNTWHGGWGTGPRYLAPAIPFLAAPMVFVVRRNRKLACAVFVVSVALNVLNTSVDPQSPLGVNLFAKTAGRAEWTYDHITEYELPLFLTGCAGPVVRAQIDEILDGVPSDQRARVEQQLQRDIQTGQSTLFPMTLNLSKLAIALVTGPVSANPIGIYEGWYARVFPPRSHQARWNSFNAGEFLFPESRWSLLPLLLIETLLLGWALKAA